MMLGRVALTLWGKGCGGFCKSAMAEVDLSRSHRTDVSAREHSGAEATAAVPNREADPCFVRRHGSSKPLFRRFCCSSCDGMGPTSKLSIFLELAESVSWCSGDLKYVTLRLRCRASRASTAASTLSTIHARGRAAATLVPWRPLLSVAPTPPGRSPPTGPWPMRAIALTVYLCKMQPGRMTRP